MSNKYSAAEHQPLRSNAALERLGTFMGEWNLEFTGFHADPSTIARGRSSFRWLEDGAFLLQHAEVPNSDFPSETAVIGPDEKAGTWCMLYFDSRGVSRIYHMTLSGGIWTLWRNFPGFSQRFLGTFSDDGNTITGRWEKSTDGSIWEHDFDLTYTRVS
jgi:hypothetical protein